MEFRPSIVSIIAFQKFLLGMLVLIAPLIIFSLTQNVLFTGIGAGVCFLIVYFWSVAFFLQKITIHENRFIFYDPGAHHAHYLQKLKRISNNEYLFELATIKSLFISIETSGKFKVMRFYESYSKLRNSKKIFNFNYTQDELFSITGIWTETDLEMIRDQIKKTNPHLKEVKIEYFL